MEKYGTEGRSSRRGLSQPRRKRGFIKPPNVKEAIAEQNQRNYYSNTPQSAQWNRGMACIRRSEKDGVSRLIVRFASQHSCGEDGFFNSPERVVPLMESRFLSTSAQTNKKEYDPVGENLESS